MRNIKFENGTERSGAVDLGFLGGVGWSIGIDGEGRFDTNVEKDEAWSLSWESKYFRGVLEWRLSRGYDFSRE